MCRFNRPLVHLIEWPSDIKPYDISPKRHKRADRPVIETKRSEHNIPLCGGYLPSVRPLGHRKRSGTRY